MRFALFVTAAALLLSACGADAPPIAPPVEEPARGSGVYLSGEARIGIAGTL